MRDRIIAAASNQLSGHGYEEVGLKEIGAAVGITRSGVLYHFATKADLFSAVIEPFVHGLEARLGVLERTGVRQRPEAVLGAVLDVVLEHQVAAELIAFDISGRRAVDLQDWTQRQVERVLRLLIPPTGGTIVDRLRGLAALSALVGGIRALPSPLRPEHREVILRCSVAAASRGGRPT